jgi:SAM-dependent methyltransferase
MTTSFGSAAEPPHAELGAFPWPPLVAGAASPTWRGTAFRLPDGTSSSVLVYAENTSHWSEELTQLHETEAGEGDHPIDRASRQLALDSVQRQFAALPGAVLDAGCSSGFFLRDLRRQLPQVPAIGADYIAGPLVRLAKTLPGTPLLQFDLRTCPLPNDCLSAVVCLNVLEHIDDDERALREIHRVLRRGGIAHVEVPASPSCYDIYDEQLMHHRRYRLRELTSKAAAAGFRIVSATHLGVLVYPAFYLIKKRNRRLLALPPGEKRQLVSRMMRTTRRSPLVGAAMKVELVLGQILRFPLGIRCVTVLQKL